MTTGKQIRSRGRTNVSRPAARLACAAAVILLAAPATAQTNHGGFDRNDDYDQRGSFVGDLHDQPAPNHEQSYDQQYDADVAYEGAYESPATYGDRDDYDYDYNYGYDYEQEYDLAYGDASSNDEQIDQVGFFCDKSSPSCDGCGAAPVCCRCIPWWAHRTGGFGQFLLLRPGNTDVVYAIEQDAQAINDNPTGPIGRVNIDEEAGFRVGAAYAMNDCSSLVSSFTRFTGDTRDFIQADAGRVLFSPVFHPSEDNVGSESGSAEAESGIDFQLVDLAVRHKWRACNTYVINWLAGFRYGNLEQQFAAQQVMPATDGIRALQTEMEFNGFGMLLGLDATKRSLHSGLSMYGRGIGSFLAGDWRGSYRNANLTTGGGVIGNDYEDFRVTPVLELELGFGWTSKCGRWHLNAGYLTSAWYDAVSTRNYIDAVRASDYRDLQERITFSGLTAGIEGRF